MPIKYQGKKYSFNQLQSVIEKKRPDIKNPGGYVKAIEENQKNASQFRLPPMNLDTDDGEFATYFFIKGDTVNGRLWGVSEESIPQNIYTAIGMPAVVTSNEYIKNSVYGHIWDHASILHWPALGIAQAGTFDPNDLSLIYMWQNKFKVGTIYDVYKRNDIWRADIKKEKKYERLVWPQFCSPTIYKLDDNEPDTRITKWRVLQLALLKEKPAFGDIALFKASCTGGFHSCNDRLKEASSGGLCAVGKMKRDLAILSIKSRMATLLSPTNAATNRQVILGQKKKKYKSKIFQAAFDTADLHGIGKNKPDSEFNALQLLHGTRIELEHTNNPKIAKQIAKDHLTEDADYYKKLATIERQKDAAEFNEDDHPRAPPGSSHGGEFVCKRCGNIYATEDKEKHLAEHLNETPKASKSFKRQYTTAHANRFDALFSDRNDPRDRARDLKDAAEIKLLGTNDYRNYDDRVIDSWNIPDEELDFAAIPTVADKSTTTYEDFRKFMIQRAREGKSSVYSKMSEKEMQEEYKRQYMPDYVIEKNVDDPNHRYLATPDEYDNKDKLAEDSRVIDKPHVWVAGEMYPQNYKFTTTERKKMYIKEMLFGSQDSLHIKPQKELDEYADRWNRFAANNPDAPIVKMIQQTEDEYGRKWNEKWDKLYKSSPSFFRGTKGLGELDQYLETGKLGGDKNGYNYVAVTADPEKASEFSDGVIFEYDGDSVRQYGTKVNYTFNPTAKGLSSSINNLESMDRPMHVGYSKELEVRLPEQLPIKNTRIKRMIVNENVFKNSGMTTKQFKEKYKGITDDIVFVNFIFNSHGLWHTIDNPEKHRIPFSDRPEAKKYKSESDYAREKGYDSLG